MKIESTVDELEVAKFAKLSAQWWDKSGPLKTLHAINPARVAFVEKQTSLSDLRVLDIGCGGGILSEAMAGLGAKVVGLDVEKDSIATAIAHARENNLNIEYHCNPIETFYQEAFDLITCMEMLEHVPNPLMVLEHAARLLKPGGYLCLSTINRTVQAYAGVVIVAEYMLNLLPRQTHDFDKFIKPSELAHMCRQSGFEVIDLAGVSYNPLQNTATLKKSVTINYLLACRKQ